MGCRKLRTFPGKFLNLRKSADVKDLTNIMSVVSFRNSKDLESKSMQTDSVDEIHVHPSYNNDSHGFDIALLRFCST